MGVGIGFGDIFRVFKKKSLEGTPQSIAYRNLGHSIWGEIPIDIVAYIVHIEQDPLVK